MARPRKEGLSYFPLDTDFFSDPKIKILKARFGTDGITLFLYLLCQIYRNGYYIKADKDFEYIVSDDLNMSTDKVRQIMKFLLERSLLDSKLFQSDTILTAAGIQRRFLNAVKERAKKNPIQVGEYWILSKEESEPFIKCTHFDGYSENNDSSSGNNSDYSPEESLKKSKVKDIYIKELEDPILRKAFDDYVAVRIKKWGPIESEQLKIIQEELIDLATDQAERLTILKNATAGGWKNLYPIKKKERPEPKQQVNKNKFNNFKGRDYKDMDDLTRKLIE